MQLPAVPYIITPSTGQHTENIQIEILQTYSGLGDKLLKEMNLSAI